MATDRKELDRLFNEANDLIIAIRDPWTRPYLKQVEYYPGCFTVVTTSDKEEWEKRQAKRD